MSVATALLHLFLLDLAIDGLSLLLFLLKLDLLHLQLLLEAGLHSLLLRRRLAFLLSASLQVVIEILLSLEQLLTLDEKWVTLRETLENGVLHKWILFVTSLRVGSLPRVLINELVVAIIAIARAALLLLDSHIEGSSRLDGIFGAAHLISLVL